MAIPGSSKHIRASDLSASPHLCNCRLTSQCLDRSTQIEHTFAVAGANITHDGVRYQKTRNLP